MTTLKPWVGVFWALLALGSLPARADHISDEKFLEVYKALMIPACEYKKQAEGGDKDCQEIDPAVIACWKEKLHMHYDANTIMDFLEEIRASNEKYAAYNEPYYNEFFSNTNWDNILHVTGNC